MWLKVPESRLCPNCEVPNEHWVLYGQSGRTVGEATFCPICYPDVKGIFEEGPSHSQGEALQTSRAWTKAGTAIQMPDAA
ncbi:MAG: hypothetical protein ACREIE_08080 [Nitrospiraceae bacterium]